MKLNKKSIDQLQKKVLRWYENNGRDFPWRHTHDPYHIFVCEVMSQQTQITRVIEKYHQWMNRFPTISDLAAASKADVLDVWSGLGYNRRALYMHTCACVIHEQYGDHFPDKLENLLQLPGIGEYTAAAILCFAFKKQLPVIDTNVKKVIALEFFNGKIPDDLIIKDLAQQLVPIGNAYTWNQALMDYAALVLKKDKIPIPKQKAFKDSNRYYRGKIVKYMISQKTVSPKVLYEQVQDSLDHSRFEDILASLVKDELLILQDDVITLPL